MAPDVFDESSDLAVLAVHVGALVDRWQEARLPVLRIHLRAADGAHGDEAGQVCVFGAQPVGDPGADAGPALAGVATIHHQVTDVVVGRVGVHRADHADVINHRTDVR